MCSINGFNFNNLGLVSKMAYYSESRGPDKNKSIVIGNFSFSFNLLAISSLNIEKSIQPVSNDKYVMLFNGEIYNASELCKKYDLESNFESDTEFLFKFINIFHIDKVCELEGMFTISLFEIETEKIHLIRDKFGTKPLYYYYDSQNFIFSSHINSLFLHENLKKRINPIALQTYLKFGYSLGFQSFFQNIFKVDPGEIITFDNKIKKISNTFFNKISKNFFFNYNSFSKCISNSFIADTPLALLLSGGLDSNILLYEFLSNKPKDQINTFSTSFLNVDSKYNEDSIMAKKVALNTGINHHNLEISFKKFKETYEESYSILYEPKLNKSITVYYLMMECLKKNNFKAIISGDGSDEMFLGYNKHIFINKILTSIRKKDFMKIFGLRSYKGISFLLKNINLIIKKDSYGLFDLYQTQENIPMQKNTILYLKNYFKNLIKDSNVVNEFINYELKSWLIEDSLMIKDNLGMNFGVETRFPFLQHSILNSLEHFDISEKVDMAGKTLLRNSYKNKIPNYILNKKKTGWEIPINWLLDKDIQSIKENKIYDKTFVSFLKDYGVTIDSSRLNDIKYSNSLFSLSCWLNRNYF